MEALVEVLVVVDHLATEDSEMTHIVIVGIVLLDNEKFFSFNKKYNI